MNDVIAITSSTEEEKEYVLNALVKYNVQRVGLEDAFENINFVAKNEKGKIIGGINSILHSSGVLRIDILWVREAYRFKRIGTQLMEKVEEAAIQKGGSLIHLDTFDFQAKDFYLKHGFEVFGTLEDCPPGHRRFYMKKKI